jgi:hypothetical protein
MPEAVGRLRISHERVSWKPIDGDVVILDLQTSAYITLNASAALLWTCLDESATPDELSAALVGAYAITPEQARTDVERFLASCREHELVEDAG